MSGLFSLVAAGIVVITVYTLMDKNKKSQVSLEKKSRMVPAWAGEPSNELINPMNIRGVFNSTDPVSDTDEGPFGIPRKMREGSRLDPLNSYPTFGETLETY